MKRTKKWFEEHNYPWPETYTLVSPIWREVLNDPEVVNLAKKLINDNAEIFQRGFTQEGILSDVDKGRDYYRTLCQFAYPETQYNTWQRDCFCTYMQDKIDHQWFYIESDHMYRQYGKYIHLVGENRVKQRFKSFILKQIRDTGKKFVERNTVKVEKKKKIL